MKDGFIKVAAASIVTTVGNPTKNAAEIIKQIHSANDAKVNLLVFPELCITGYTCGDLFYNTLLTDGALEALNNICKATEELYPIVVVGLPIRFRQKLYNCAAVIGQGNILGIVPKIQLADHGEFCENRHFTSGAETVDNDVLIYKNEEIPFGTQLLFRHEEIENFCFSVEIGNDLWAAIPPCTYATAAGALLIANPSASNEVVARSDYRQLLVKSTSSRLFCGYISANAGPGESTQDLVFSRHHLIAENGTILAENKPFDPQDLIITEIDLQMLSAERAKNSNFEDYCDGYTEIFFDQNIRNTELTRIFNRNPFIPQNCNMDERAELILQTQAHGLKKRLEHTHANCAVIGISGGLDSTLALLVAVRAMKLLGRETTDILAVTMPCFGTSARTKNNAVTLCNELNVKLIEVDITKSVQQHFADIGHDESKLDVTFENSQARERTQVLMDLANKYNGLLVGTGDLSELALGWATYNGDHMSMYGVNGSVPKTLVRYLVQYEAEHSPLALRKTLLDVIDTPVSPELLPADQNGNIAQKTEDLVGPYELHDFYLYHFIRFGYKPAKLLRMAKYVFEGIYSDEVLVHWLRTFLCRFFNQQFKRSCLPDGPKVGSVSLSPRGDWQMPTDASSELWLDQLN